MSKRNLKLPHGVAVTVDQPYAEGHILTALEADKLNHVYADSIRSAIVNKLKRLVENAGFDADEASAEFQTYADSYSFTVRAPKAGADPIVKEANKLAKEQVFAAIRKKGGDPKDYSAEQISEYIAKVLQHKPEIHEEAARRVKSTQALAGDVLSDLFDVAA